MIRYILIAWVLFCVGCSADVFDSGDGGDPGDAQSDAAMSGDAVALDAGVSSDSDSAVVDGSADVVIDVVVPPTSYRVFVTSQAFSPNFGGLSGADSVCSSAATGAGLGGAWKAWLSASFQSASSRLIHSSVPYKLIDGSVVALDWGHLVSGNIVRAIDQDEHGSTANADAGTLLYVATGTYYDGTPGTSEFTCNDWTSSDTPYQVVGGDGYQSTMNWTQWSAFSCKNNAPFHLYCIEQ